MVDFIFLLLSSSFDSVVVFCFLFVPLLYLLTIYFFYLAGQSVSCKASLAALRLYGYFCDIVVLLSENKYDDDDE